MSVHWGGRGPGHVSRSTSASGGVAAGINALLREDGSFILREDGTYILREDPITTLSAAVIAFDVADGWVTGQNPPALTITLPINGSVQIGDWYRIEHSQDSFSTSLFTAWTQITSDDVINSIENGGYTFTWDTTTLPAGSTSFRLFFGRGANAGAITLQSVASNVITDTMASPAATITLTDGAYNTASTDKAKYIAVAAPDYQAICGADIGLYGYARSNKPIANLNSYAEFRVDGVTGAVPLGLDDGSINLATMNAGAGYFANNAALPGASGGTAGMTILFALGFTSLVVIANGAENDTFGTITAGGGLAVNDRIGVALNRTSKLITLTHIRAGVVHVIGTLTLASQIPASFYPFAGGKNGNGTAATSDATTFFPKVADWTGTAPDGTYTFMA